jgi:hypothetical protein
VDISIDFVYRRVIVNNNVAISVVC